MLFPTTMGKKLNKTIDVLEKAYKIATSPETKKVAKAALKFARDSGLGEKALDYVNNKVSKKTKKNHRLDHIRKTLYNISKDDLISKRENKTLAAAILDFTRGSGLGKKAVEYANKKIKKKTKGNKIHDTLRDIAYNEAGNFLDEDNPKRSRYEPGHYAKQQLFNQILGAATKPSSIKSPAVGRAPTSASTTPVARYR